MKRKKLNLFINSVLGIILCIVAPYANSIESWNKGWAVATVIGSISEYSPFMYYLEPQIRLADDNYVFNQLLLLAGIGYQLQQNIAVFIGPGWVLTKTPEGNITHEKRLWEQINWSSQNTSISINSRLRLEERVNTKYTQTAVRLRERIWIRIPFSFWPNYSFSCFDEVFFNLNHPQWTSPYFFEQNRAFVGISKQLSKETIIDIGYLNQYLHSVNSQLNNVLLINFSITIT